MEENKDYLLGMVCAVNAMDRYRGFDHIIRTITKAGGKVSEESIEYIKDEFASTYYHSDGTLDKPMSYALKNGGYRVLRPSINDGLMNKTMLTFHKNGRSGNRKQSLSQFKTILSDMGIDPDKLQRYVIRVSTKVSDYYYDDAIMRSDCFITYNTSNFEAGMLKILNHDEQPFDATATELVFDIFDNVHHFKVSEIVDLETLRE